MSQITVTAPTGPGLSVASLVIPDVLDVEINSAPDNVAIVRTAKRIYEFDINATTTLTCSIAAGVATWVLSQ